MINYKVIFDKVMLKQLKKAGKNKQIRDILSDMLNKIEEFGPRAGELLDSRLHLYERKMKRPPIRLYFKHNIFTSEIYIFEYEMKTSENKQRITIEKIKKKVSES